MSELGWIDLGNGRKVFRRLDSGHERARSDFPRPYTQSDGIDDLRHPITGQLVGSKSQFRRITKEHGAVEIGTDRITPQRVESRPVRDDVQRALAMLNQGYTPKPISKDEFDGNS